MIRSSWSEYLFEQYALCNDPKQAAILLLCLNSMASNHIRLLGNNNRLGGSESSMEKSLVKKVAGHYAKHIEPKFSNKFTLEGGVEGIEKTIKWVILNKIIKTTSEPTLQSDIILRKENILEGIEKDILWARSIFTSKNDIYHIAWRAYDRDAKTVLWENLLTAPKKSDEKTIIYSTVETGSGERNLISASNTIRKMAAVIIRNYSKNEKHFLINICLP